MTSKIDINTRLQDAVQSYWDVRAKNKQKQVESGKIDAGTRGEVTGGTQIGALEVLIADILCEAGLKRIDVRIRTALELPGHSARPRSGTSLLSPRGNWSSRWTSSRTLASRSEQLQQPR
nr:PaeR7I family type II restriction endonuclease [Chitinolyticbacter albus]